MWPFKKRDTIGQVMLLTREIGFLECKLQLREKEIEELKEKLKRKDKGFRSLQRKYEKVRTNV